MAHSSILGMKNYPQISVIISFFSSVKLKKACYFTLELSNISDYCIFPRQAKFVRSEPISVGSPMLSYGTTWIILLKDSFLKILVRLI